MAVATKTTYTVGSKLASDADGPRYTATLLVEVTTPSSRNPTIGILVDYVKDTLSTMRDDGEIDGYAIYEAK